MLTLSVFSRQRDTLGAYMKSCWGFMGTQKSLGLVSLFLVLCVSSSAFAQEVTLTTDLVGEASEFGSDAINRNDPIRLNLVVDLGSSNRALNYLITANAGNDCLVDANQPIIVDEVSPSGIPTSDRIDFTFSPNFAVGVRSLIEKNPSLAGINLQLPVEQDVTICAFLYDQFEECRNENNSDGLCRTATLQFRYDTTPPGTVSINGEPVPGERSVSVSWNRLSGDIGNYYIDYCVFDSGTDTSTETVQLAFWPNNCLRSGDESFGPEQSSGQANGFSVGERVAVAVTASDSLGNRSEPVTVWAVSTRPIDDFFELCQRDGSCAEDGGFCFVATAAHGSYAHPIVRVLRTFRDSVLAIVPFGRMLTWTYYQQSPPAAQAIAANASAAQMARAGLLPIALMAIFMMLVPVIMFGWLIGRTSIFRGKWSFLGLFVLVLGLGLVSASAQAGPGQRPKSTKSIGLGFEFEIGQYLPDMGDPDSDSHIEAFTQSFGDADEATHLLFQLGMEIQFIRAKFGTIGVGANIGYSKWDGVGIDDQGGRTDIENTLHIIPMNLTLNYRFDYLLDHTKIPLAPYVKGGLAYYAWWANREDGSFSRAEGNVANGGKLGYTGTVGLALSLNFIDRQSVGSLYSSTGIRSTYVFFELQTSVVDGFGDDGFDFSDNTWNAGLFLEI